MFRELGFEVTYMKWGFSFGKTEVLVSCHMCEVRHRFHPHYCKLCINGWVESFLESYFLANHILW